MDKKKPGLISIIIFTSIGITFAMLWQFGGALLEEGPLADLIRKYQASAPVSTKWVYKQTTLSSNGTVIKGAYLTSLNTNDTGFGPTARMKLILFENEHQRYVAVQCMQGVPLCASSRHDCAVSMAIDNGPVEMVKANYSDNNLLLDNSESLFTRIKSSKQLTVGAMYVTGKGRFQCRFDFDTSDLVWKD